MTKTVLTLYSKGISFYCSLIHKRTTGILHTSTFYAQNVITDRFPWSVNQIPNIKVKNF